MAPVGLLGYGSTSSLVRGVIARAHRLRRQTEAVVLAGDDLPDNTAAHSDQRSVADKGRRGNDRLIARTDQAADGKVNGLTSAHGDQDLVLRRVMQRKPPRKIVGNLPAQLRQAGISAYTWCVLP